MINIDPPECCYYCSTDCAQRGLQRGCITGNFKMKDKIEPIKSTFIMRDNKHEYRSEDGVNWKVSNRKMAKKYSNAKITNDEDGLKIWSGYVSENAILDLETEDDLREIETAINNYFREKK